MCMRRLLGDTHANVFVTKSQKETKQSHVFLLSKKIIGALWARNGVASSPLLGRNVDSCRHYSTNCLGLGRFESETE